jgi:hypothetical protein
MNLIACSGDVYAKMSKGLQRFRIANCDEAEVTTEGQLRHVSFVLDGVRYEWRVIGHQMWLMDATGECLGHFIHGELVHPNPKLAHRI